MVWGLAIVIALVAAVNWYSRRPQRDDDGLVLAGSLGIGLRRLLPAVRRRAPRLFGPVAAYVAVIAIMAIASWWGGHWAAPAAAAVFAVSDLTLADNKFVAGRPWSPVIVMITYHLALALLVVSLT